MKFWLRWLANGIAIFLALYLVDSLLHGRFQLGSHLGGGRRRDPPRLPQQLRPAPSPRQEQAPQAQSLVAVLTVLVNALILQLFVWVGADVTTQGFVWVLLAAAFVTLLAGLINWLMGFNQQGETSPGHPAKSPRRAPTGSNGRKPARG